MSEAREQERAEHEAAVRLADAARAAMNNEAIVAYLDEVERKAIDAMLLCSAIQDLERLRLGVVANTIRQMKQFMRDALPAGEYAAKMLERIAQEENAR